MENVLDIYAQPHDPRRPVVCMEASLAADREGGGRPDAVAESRQLIGETRVPIPATKNHAQRVDYEYERRGTASIFMFAEPLAAFRQATARPQRTKSDWALEVAHLLDTRYADCEQVTLVSDNLNTHTIGAFYEAFSAPQARAYVQRLRLVHTPKHGSWLNIAECELSCLTRQCLAGRRIGDLDILQSEIAVWSRKINSRQRGVDWHFQVDDARVKLKRLYPQIKT